jgi:Putative Actinobacterial Holin-X, holin superfamily III
VGSISRGTRGVDTQPLRQSGNDAAQLVIDYIKQETVEPVQNLGRFLGYGIAGSFLLCVGLLLLLVGLLRLLQTETDTAFTGDLSWIPYLIVTVVGLGVMGLAGWRVTKGQAERRLPATDQGGGA